MDEVTPRVRRQMGSWGNIFRQPQVVASPFHIAEAALAVDQLVRENGSVLPYGLGRSYGDSCLNTEGGLVATSRMDRIQAFDHQTGLFRAEAGMSLAAIHGVTVPEGLMLPVTPGTKFVTLGGAVANDVHGKNHHIAGSFGHHVRRLGLLRTDGTVIECSRERETGLFSATIGGLGLTGFILWVEIALMPITSSDCEVENIRFGGLRDFFELSRDSAGWTYTVAWIDCLARGKNLGRGIFSRARHAPSGPLTAGGPPRLRVPVTPPVSLVNNASVHIFNELYYHRPRKVGRHIASYDGVLYPLDGIARWNRIYGPRGFYQYQCLVPPDRAEQDITALLQRIASVGDGSFLVVLKNFGASAPAGLLSFPAEGTTLALDFTNRGDATLRLLNSLDEIVRAAGGRLYPAKDARMSPAMFAAGFRTQAAFEGFRDPGFRSDFWRRTKGG